METKIPLKQITPTPPSQTETTASLDSLENRLDTLENLNISNRLNSVENNFSNYLPLSGGSMSGRLTFNLNSSYNSPLHFNNVTYSGSQTYNQCLIAAYAGQETDTVGEVIFTNWNNGSRIVYIRAHDSTGYSEITVRRENGVNSATAPTPATNDNSTKIATTAYVKSNLAGYMPLYPGFLELSERTPYIDFHYERSSADNTARIIQDRPEVLKLSIKNSAITSEKYLELNYSNGLYWNGYPVGIYQFGETSSITADGGGYGSIQVSFSKAFIDTPAVMVISNGGGGSPTFIATLSSVTTAGFSMVYYNVYTSSKTATFKWVAIGKM